MTEQNTQAETRVYEVTAARDGKWWYFRIPELDTSGQARTLEEVPFEATDIIATWLRVDESEVGVKLTVELPAEIESRLAEANQREEVGRVAVCDAARLRREAVVMLKEQGLSQKDTSRVLGVSPQRVNQLIHQ